MSLKKADKIQIKRYTSDIHNKNPIQKYKRHCRVRIRDKRWPVF